MRKLLGVSLDRHFFFLVYLTVFQMEWNGFRPRTWKLNDCPIIL